MAGEPFSHAASPEQTKREAARRLLVKSYKATFSTEHGKRVLADLKLRFGFDVCEADSELLSDNIIARRCFAKRPIHHIEKMRNASLELVRKPKRGKSAHHEDESTPAHGT